MTRVRLSLALSAAGLTIVVGAAQVQKGGAVVLKGRAPVATDVLKIKLPRPAEADLPNGPHLMVLEDRRAPQVSFQIQIPGAGGYFDPADLPGLAVMTTATMREGTSTRTTQQISEMLETKASAVGVSTGFGSVTAIVSGSSLTEHFADTLALAADILLHPTFPQEEFDRYKTRARAPLVSQRASPGFLANEMFSRLMFGTHPAGRVALTADALDRATRDRLVAFHQGRFVSDHAVLGIAGDLSMADARKLAEAHLGPWKKRGIAAGTVADPTPVAPGAVHYIARPNSVQTSLWVGTQGISRTSPDYDVVQVMNAIVGGGPTGRLFTILREEKGYTYGAGSNVSASQYRGTWLATTDVRSEVTEPALRDLIAEIRRIRDEAASTKEFEDRKRGMVASFALSLESPGGILGSHITRWTYRLPADYWDTYPARVMSVTPAQVQAAAKKYLDPSRLHIVAVGDPAKADLFKAYGTVTVYDTSGKAVGR